MGCLSKVLSFYADGTLYVADLLKVKEIIQMVSITKVPKAPLYIEGVINLRGKIIPVVDLKKRMGKDGARDLSGEVIIIFEPEKVVEEKVVEGKVPECGSESENSSGKEGIEEINVRRIIRTQVGLIVDGVAEVLNVREEEIDKTDGRNYIKGILKIDNRIGFLLDIDSLLLEDNYCE